MNCWEGDADQYTAYELRTELADLCNSSSPRDIYNMVRFCSIVIVLMVLTMLKRLRIATLNK